MSESHDVFGDESEGIAPPALPDFSSLNDDEDVQDDADVAPEGTVRVATRRGYKFVLPGSDGAPDFEITTEPVPVPEEAVEALIKASNGRVYRVDPETEEEV